jgi:transposase
VSLAALRLPGPSSLRLNQISTCGERMLVDLTASQQTASCPSCAALSAKIHASSQRRVADLPWAGVPVQLLLHVRRFVCTVDTCPRLELIARDRAGSCAEGARQGAPDAVQVADRFHLVKSLRDALERILNRMMERDDAAVAAGLRLPYSTGPVEGTINRLKLIKRSGYGRAGFDVLRVAAGGLSLGLQELLALLGATQDSFAQASSMLAHLCLVQVCPNSARAATEELGPGWPNTPKTK